MPPAVPTASNGTGSAADLPNETRKETVEPDTPAAEPITADALDPIAEESIETPAKPEGSDPTPSITEPLDQTAAAAPAPAEAPKNS